MGGATKVARQRSFKKKQKKQGLTFAGEHAESINESSGIVEGAQHKDVGLIRGTGNEAQLGQVDVADADRVHLNVGRRYMKRKYSRTSLIRPSVIWLLQLSSH